jgi:hypothetical protein
MDADYWLQVVAPSREMQMKHDKFTRALTIRATAKITRNDQGVYAVPSASTATVYLVTRDGCSCPAMGLCSHQLASVFYDATIFVQLIRWSTDIEFLQAAVEKYQATMQGYPEKIRAAVRAEYVAALARLRGEVNRPASKYVKRYSQGVHLVERRQEPQRIGGLEI